LGVLDSTCHEPCTPLSSPGIPVDIIQTPAAAAAAGRHTHTHGQSRKTIKKEEEEEEKAIQGD
jgi:hypothetical protein